MGNATFRFGPLTLVACLSLALLQSEVGERFEPYIRGGGTAFPCIPLHFNHYGELSTAWQYLQEMLAKMKVCAFSFTAGRIRKKFSSIFAASATSAIQVIINWLQPQSLWMAVSQTLERSRTCLFGSNKIIKWIILSWTLLTDDRRSIADHRRPSLSTDNNWRVACNNWIT